MREDKKVAFTEIVQLQPCSGPSIFECFYQINIIRIWAHLLCQKLLAAAQLGFVAVIGDAAGPVVRQENIQGLLQLHQSVHIQLSYVVCTAHGALGVGRHLEMPLRSGA